jgi:hypothetical protein
MIKHGIVNSIILEENDNNYYITLPHRKEFEDDIYERLYQKYDLNILNYKTDNIYDSFLMLKIVHKEVETVSEDIAKVEIISSSTEIKSLSDLEQELEETFVEDRNYSLSEKITPEIFLSELDPSYEDKIEDFLDSLGCLNTEIYNFEKSQTLEDGYNSIKEILTYIYSFTALVDSMALFNVVSRAFSILIDFLENLEQDILLNNEKRVLLSKMLLSIVNDLEDWIIALFIDRNSNDIHYFDTVFSANCLTIISTFVEEEDDLEFL